ncbi:MAG: HAD family phosphatase [Chthoniobacterales bacterium]|jgi:beta-phosphoglucomutase family hydrolase|nr:HAD family phosphatase [Chthoniobacterales bacterium]
MLRAVIFDWDGVVVDSSAHHERSWEILAAERGLDLPADHFKRGFGKKNNVIIPDLGWAKDPADVEALAHQKEEIYRSLVREKGIEPLHGVRELLGALRNEGLPCAIASSTERANLDLPLDLMGLREFFRVIVSGEEVVHGKPDPSVFLLAADRLGLAPAECVVIEDALVGIEAAKRAGMAVLAVATTNPLAALGSADGAVESMADVTIGRLASLAGR